MRKCILDMAVTTYHDCDSVLAARFDLLQIFKISKAYEECSNAPTIDALYRKKLIT